MPKIGFTGSRIAHSAQNSMINAMELIPGPSFKKKKNEFSKKGVGGRGEAQKMRRGRAQSLPITACRIIYNVVFRAMHD